MGGRRAGRRRARGRSAHAGQSPCARGGVLSGIGEQELAGCRILLTAYRRGDELGSALHRRGAEIVQAPVLSIVPHVDDVQLLHATREVVARHPHVVVVTTGVGFRGWVEAADAAGLGEALRGVLGEAQIVARGPKAHGAIQAAGFRPAWVAPSETSAEVAERLLAEGMRGRVVAVQHHGAGADGLDEALAAAGASVIPLVVYRWGPPPDPAAVRRAVAAVAAGDVDGVVFTSAPGARAFLDAARAEGLFDEVVQALAGTVLTAAVGPVTAAPLTELGLAPIVPDRWRLGALIRELVAVLSRHRQEVATSAGALRLRRSCVSLDGRPLTMTAATAAVLRLLVDADGAVVTREEIVAALPGGASASHAAEMAIARLRDALGRRDLVETVVKRGYRLRRSDDPVPSDASDGAVAAR